MINNYTFEEFIRNYAKEKNKCHYYNEYPPEIQNIIKEIYLMCRRTMMTAPHILYMLNQVLSKFDEIKDKYNCMKNNINDYDDKIKARKKKIEKLEIEIEELKTQKETMQNKKSSDDYSITGIANYLGVSRQTIYNLKKRGELK